MDLFFRGSTSNHAVALSNSAKGRQLPFHAPCMPHPMLSQCSANDSANVQPMLSQCPANVQPMLSQCPVCSANVQYAQPMSSLCSANVQYAQPMSSLCSANVQPTLSQCPAYAQLPKMPSQCLAKASASPANAQQANAQPMPKGFTASMINSPRSWHKSVGPNIDANCIPGLEC